MEAHSCHCDEENKNPVSHNYDSVSHNYDLVSLLSKFSVTLLLLRLKINGLVQYFSCYTPPSYKGFKISRLCVLGVWERY